ncbi:lipid II flippase Amj family protein [Anaerocolumna sp. MB42-C2]|uniref:lipid II flippase Amj family protein n=1 Tax=Anaerocolumna sp. MB42-C2 TaxID=3070997 RepID=UPI0027E183E6|nr:lipid II flippase Amj family protein [Anaerocolumna sp. MB42-C2]WMJ89710.1 lipid II flippase Amj family protein [Anaerocolumna sp. MB42-C2]
MNLQIVTVLFLNFIISIIGTLAYSVRLVGVRTGKIAVTYSVFNILTLISRIAVTFQVPILTKFVENNSGGSDLISIFNLIIIVSGIATIAGAFLIPTFQRIFYRGVLRFSIDKSIPKLIMHSFSKTGINYMRECIAIPVKNNLTKINYKKLPVKIVIFNLIAVSLITVGSLAPIYAGKLAPDLRATCITLSSIINGVATVLMSIFIDPQLSIMTDEVIDGKCTEEDFRTCVVAMVGSKSLGTFASLLLLIPASYLIVFIARII